MKSNFCQQPFKLIDIDENGLYHVVEQTLTLIQSMSQSLAVVSIAGQYRTGKSYLLNRVILNRADGFQVGSTINSCTKGLWVWGKPLIGKTAHNELINILVIDSEGFGSTEQEINYDTKLFALNMLLTSCFLYNSMGAIDQNSIQNLAVIAQIIKGISKQSKNELDSPQLLWILRDFCLQLVSNEGESFSSKQYLEKALEYTKQQSRNKIRKLLMSVFRDRDCITLVRPLTQQQNLAELNKLQLQDLRPEFIEQAISIRKRLLSEIKPKKYFGREVDGALFCKMIRNYVQIINNNCVPQIQNIWQYVSQECIHEATAYFEEQLDLTIKQRINSKLPISDEELNKILESIQSMLLEQLKVKISNYEGSQQCILKCRKAVTKKCLQVHICNETKLKSEIEKLVSIEYLMIEKKIGSNELSSIESLINEFHKCSDSISKKIHIKGSKISQIVTSISMNKIIESSKSLMYIKNKQIDNLKYKLKEEEIKYEQQLRQLRGQLNNSKSTSILEINRLQSDRKQLQIRQHNLQQIISQLKQQRSRFEESIETESRRQKSMSVRTVSEMRFKLDQFSDKTEESERKIMMIKSEHSKTEALLRQKIEFQEKMIEEVKQQANKYSERAKKLKETYGVEIKELTMGLQELNKEKLQEMMGYNSRISDLQMEVARKSEEVEEERFRREKVVSEYCFKEDELKKKIEQLELVLKDKESKRASSDKLMENINKNFGKIEGLQKSMTEREEQIIQLKNELKLKEAILGQKVEFYEMEIGQINRKYEDELGKNTALMNIIGIKQEQMAKELKQKYEQNIKEIENQYTFEITHLKQQLEESLSKKYKVQQQYSSKSSQMQQEIQQLQSRNRILEQNRNKLVETLKSVQLEKSKYLRQTEERNAQTITTLNQQIERLKTESTTEVKQLQEKNLEMMRHLKNYYQMEKEKYQKKILEYQERQKQMPIEQYESKILLLESKNTAYQHQIEQIRSQFVQSEKTQTNMIKQYQQRVSQLTVQLNLIKQQKHNYIEQSSKQRLKKQQYYIEQIESLQSSLLNCQGRLDISHSDISKKDKELLQGNQKREQLETQIVKKDQLIDELRLQIDDDRDNYERELKEMTEKYYKVSQESLRYKIESEKELALMRQETEFNKRKIVELDEEIEGLESKIASLKGEYQTQYHHLNTKHNLEIEGKIQMMDKMRRSFKQDEGKHLRSIGNLEKQKINLEQQYKLLQLKLQGINKQYNRFKQQHLLLSNPDTSQYQVQIISLKSSLKQTKSKYESQHSKLLELQSNYQRDKLLWQNKSKFLQTQRDQAKQDLTDGFKKFQTALSQINKSRNNEDSLEDITKSIERKYILQMENLKQSYDKKALESQSNVKMLNVDIKKLKSELNKEKQLYQSKLEEEIELINLANNTISQELTKQMEEKEYHYEKGKKEMVDKVNYLQKALKEQGIKMDHLRVGIEKDQVKYNIEKKSLTDNIQQLMANNQVLFRENQRFKNKEKLIGKKLIKEY